MIREKYRTAIPAVTHVDSSGRVQTVDKDDNSDFYAILREFEKLTGLPIVLNTSFNINGEPIVLSPDDALNTFFNSGLEHLFIEDFYVDKRLKTISDQASPIQKLTSKDGNGTGNNPVELETVPVK
jgi:carbamoyltransferase